MTQITPQRFYINSNYKNNLSVGNSNLSDYNDADKFVSKNDSKKSSKTSKIIIGAIVSALVGVGSVLLAKKLKPKKIVEKIIKEGENIVTEGKDTLVKAEDEIQNTTIKTVEEVTSESKPKVNEIVTNIIKPNKTTNTYYDIEKGVKCTKTVEGDRVVELQYHYATKTQIENYNKNGVKIKNTVLSDFPYEISIETFYDKTGKNVVKTICKENKLQNPVTTIIQNDKLGNFKHRITIESSDVIIDSLNKGRQVYNGLLVEDVPQILNLEKKFGKFSNEESIELFVKIFKEPQAFSKVEKVVFQNNLSSRFLNNASGTGRVAVGDLDYYNLLLKENRVTTEISEKMNKIDEIYSQLLPRNIESTAFRGEMYDANKARYSEYMNIKVGDIFENKLYTHATNNLSTAYHYNGGSNNGINKSVLHVVKLPKGSTHCDEIVAIHNSEFTIARNANFKVLRKEVNENGDLLIFSEYISPKMKLCNQISAV